MMATTVDHYQSQSSPPSDYLFGSQQRRSPTKDLVGLHVRHVALIVPHFADLHHPLAYATRACLRMPEADRRASTSATRRPSPSFGATISSSSRPRKGVKCASPIALS